MAQDRVPSRSLGVAGQSSQSASLVRRLCRTGVGCVSSYPQLNVHHGPSPANCLCWVISVFKLHSKLDVLRLVLLCLLSATVHHFLDFHAASFGQGRTM